MRHYFLGAAAGFTRKERLAHTFAVGRERDRGALCRYLARHYRGEAILCKNGRSALALALMAYFEPGDAVIVNGFTCYAVYEAVKAAGLKPVFADIAAGDLNYTVDSIGAKCSPVPLGHGVAPARLHGRSAPSFSAAASERSLETPDEHFTSDHGVAPSQNHGVATPRGIIVQNTLGNPVDIEAIESFAKEHGLVIIEDLAHCTGVKYADGREAGTVGAACALSFGKDKSIDTTSGGAVVLRDSCKKPIKAPCKIPKFADHVRARLYPAFGAMYRGLSYVKLSGALMRVLLALHLVERSADNKLDLERKISKFEAKLALEQLKKLKKSGESPLREFYLVDDRDEVLKELAAKGYYFGGFWYEKPVSPERYYKKVHFDEKACPQATMIAKHIVNLPTYYSEKELAPAREIIEKHLMKEAK